MRALGLGTAIALGIAGSAYAADIGVIQPVVSPEYQHPLHQQTGTSWTGFYAGIHGGWGKGDFAGCGTWGTPAPAVSWPPPCADGPNDFEIVGPFDGWLFGGQIGAKHQWDHFVVGAELSGSLSGLKHVDADGSPDVTMTLKPLGMATVNAGIAFDRILAYGLIGYGAGHVDHQNNTSGCAYQTNVGGLVYGAGIQGKVTDNISVFAEWNRIDFGDVETTCETSGPWPVDVNNRFTTKADIFKVGLNLWFGHQQTGAVSVGY